MRKSEHERIPKEISVTGNVEKVMNQLDYSSNSIVLDRGHSFGARIDGEEIIDDEVEIIKSSLGFWRSNDALKRIPKIIPEIFEIFEIRQRRAELAKSAVEISRPDRYFFSGEIKGAAALEAPHFHHHHTHPL
ncbi:hypothetical protein GWI33_010484 [Rhynchophorus ferrugineus]|uniref:Uncharacterized protein n=1 Tax=Rhynchophorus ferrugineus TaxID=354439 RepID=A0A834ISL9_RHYFE|nr:hypothetical protein GWI33_010484 [Rhynchophorus ferrugineus]